MMRPPCSGWISISQTPPCNLTPPRIVVSGGVNPLLAGVLSLCVLSACAPHTATHLPSPSPTSKPTSAPSPTPPTQPTQADKPHMFVILMENRTSDHAIAARYTAPLAPNSSASTT